MAAYGPLGNVFEVHLRVQFGRNLDFLSGPSCIATTAQRGRFGIAPGFGEQQKICWQNGQAAAAAVQKLRLNIANIDKKPRPKSTDLRIGGDNVQVELLNKKEVMATTLMPYLLHLHLDHGLPLEEGDLVDLYRRWLTAAGASETAEVVPEVAPEVVPEVATTPVRGNYLQWLFREE